jgi:putative endonuclease
MKMSKLLSPAKQLAHLEIGRRGEQIAKEYLEKKGYKIVEQNYRTRYGEIDLVAEKKNELVLVEVRTKIGDSFGAPEETINLKKLRKLRSNALAYARNRQWSGRIRVDAVGIVLKKDYSVERLNHYENIIEG